MANYHFAFAAGGTVAEWPMPSFPIREAMMIEPLRIEQGELIAPKSPGLGVKLTPAIEKEFSFREEAVYMGRPLSVDLLPDREWRECVG